MRDFGGFAGFEPNAQHNYGYSRLAMDAVQELNILNGEVAKARLINHILGSDVFGRSTITFLVEVQCVDGENVALGFEGFLENEPMLTSVESVINFPRELRGESRVQVFDWVIR
ncbi:MAG: hypothetical protein FWE02_05590 [Defluviitaleaceae bacterium]|nr:hypothetical protein [Defluviitaleaceae bacterium]